MHWSWLLKRWQTQRGDSTPRNAKLRALHTWGAAALWLSTMGGSAQALAQQPRAAPVNADATPAARAILQQLDRISGHATLSGEHNYPNTISRYSDRVYDLTGKFPAIFGQDFGFAGGEDKDSTLSRPAMIQEVIRQYRLGAIPALCWHAVPPTENEPVTFRGSILSQLTDWEFQQLLTPGTDLHARWEQQVDRIAGYLRDLQDAGVPVLFRPYHEMNGDWFWWGHRPGAKGTSALYRMLFDRYVHVHHLNNLIWVWNVAAASSKSGPASDYWPGDAYVDVVSMDIYRPFAQSDYDSMIALAGDRKPVALAEVGTLPSLATLAQQPRWTYFMIWSEFAEDHNTPDALRTMLDAQNIINRGDPRLTPPFAQPADTLLPRERQAPAATRALLTAMGAGSAHVAEINVSTMDPSALARQVKDVERNGKTPLLRWVPPSPTGNSSEPLDDFTWKELRRPETSLHRKWMTEVDALHTLLKAVQGHAVLLSLLPDGNGNFWWSRAGVDGTQALVREAQQQLTEAETASVLWVWETEAAAPEQLSLPAMLERFYPGPLWVDTYLLDAAGTTEQQNAGLAALHDMAVGRPVGLRMAAASPDPGYAHAYRVDATGPTEEQGRPDAAGPSN